MKNNRNFKFNIFSLSLYKHAILIETKLLGSCIIYRKKKKEYTIAHKAIKFKGILLQDKSRFT